MEWNRKFLVVLCLLPTLAHAECRVIEHENTREVVCEDVPPPPKPAVEEENEKAADAALKYDNCKAKIASMLRAPATAVYNLVETYYSYGDKNMKIAVDAHNGYGALIRDYYICTFDSYSRIKHFRREGEL